MRTIVEAGVLLLLVAVGTLVTQQWHPRAPALYLVNEPVAEDEVTLQDIEERWQNEVLWIDARLRSEYETAHVPGALLLNEQEADSLLFEYFERLQDNAKPIVVYCGGEACQASRKMRQYLLERLPGAEIYVLKGGWKTLQLQSAGSAQ